MYKPPVNVLDKKAAKRDQEKANAWYEWQALSVLLAVLTIIAVAIYGYISLI